MNKKSFLNYLVFLSGIILTVFLLKTSAINDLVKNYAGSDLVSSFVSGILFSSVLTTVPATIALGEIAHTSSIFWTAFFGGLGALVGDYIIFKFVRDSLSEKIISALKTVKNRKLISIFKGRKLGFISSFIGAIIIASPLPDEIGLAMMGIGGLKTYIFIPLSFSLNFIGIFLIGLVSKNF